MSWRLLNARNPLWRILGGLILVAILAVTGVYVGRGPRPLKPTSSNGRFTLGTQGRYGTVTEPLGKGLFVLAYETIRGQERDLQLQGVSGRLEEPLTLWTLLSPAARKAGDTWTLMAPMRMEARSPGSDALLGQGTIAGSAPGLGWEKGVWRGLSPLVWEDLQGSGRGRWDLPAGWYRGLDGRFVVEHGPVHWVAADPGAVHSLEANSMWAGLGFQEGHMETVNAVLEGGKVQAQVVDITPQWIRWSAPLAFQRDDGWVGSANQGQAPRPADGKPYDRVEFRDFKAQRAMPEGLEHLQADGARWSPAGLRLEGGVRWEQPLEDQPKDGKRLLLRAPRLLQRSAPGEDLPAALPVGEAWAEPQAVLTWGQRSLSSPRIEGRPKQRQWRILAPALGRSEMGSFQAGEGRGRPDRWAFDGPILAELKDGSKVRADSLAWDSTRWTLLGRPATWTRLRQRLAGPRMVYREEQVQFPDGISGALAALEGDLNLRADQGLATKTEVALVGRVECTGSGWRLRADRISVTLGPGHIVQKVRADGAVVLKGQMGEGRGDSLELDPNAKITHWQGRVQALTEVGP